MIIQSLKDHFPARLPEWFNAGMLFAWGAYVLLHPNMFTDPATEIVFSGLTDMTSWFPYHPAAVWGLATVTCGMIRGMFLFINGTYHRSPAVRLAMSAMSAFVWSQIVVGLSRSGVANTGLVIYSGLVVLDIASAYRASLDMVFAEKQYAASKTEMGSRVKRRSIGIS